MRSRAFIAASALLVLCAPSIASARQYEVTPFLGASFETAGYSAVAPSYGVAFGVRLDDSKAMELWFSRQEAEARVVDPTYAEPTYHAEAEIDRLHFGGEYRGGNSSKRSRGFVNFSMGLARIGGPQSIGDSYSFSLAFGGGLQLQASDTTRVRFQTSWISTNAGSGSVTCTTGSCVIQTEDFVGGIELSVGLTFNF
jgi:hypothetical protein